MFIISLMYTVPLEKVDEVRNEHMHFLEKYYKKSIFLSSGPKIPRTGGIILADNTTKEELEKIIQEDPFWKKQIAVYEITEFTPTMSAN
ncbi:MAG: YciI family protein [Bacillota bacterium]|nr:YciI family protein [Bacillota bacterium]